MRVAAGAPASTRQELQKDVTRFADELEDSSPCWVQNDILVIFAHVGLRHDHLAGRAEEYITGRY